MRRRAPPHGWSAGGEPAAPKHPRPSHDLGTMAAGGASRPVATFMLVAPLRRRYGAGTGQHGSRAARHPELA